MVSVARNERDAAGAGGFEARLDALAASEDKLAELLGLILARPRALVVESLLGLLRAAFQRRQNRLCLVCERFALLLLTERLRRRLGSIGGGRHLGLGGCHFDSPLYPHVGTHST